MIKFIGIVICMAFAFFLAAMVACTKGTYLTPLDQELIKGSERANIYGVTRLDGGGPSANRALDRSSCENLAKVLEHAHADAGGLACP